MKSKILTVALACLALSACQVQQEPQSSLTSLQLQSLSADITKLIKSEYLADSGLFTVVYTKLKSDNLALQYALVESLKDSGYAVQHILPEEMMQPGDSIGIKGKKVEFYVQQLKDSNFLQVTMSVGNDKYSRIYQLSPTTLLPASVWSKLNSLDSY